MDDTRRTVNSGYQDVLATTAGSPVWNPLTPAMDSAGVRNVRVNYALQGNALMEVKSGFQFSKDGLSWTATPVALEASYTSTTGWTYVAEQDLYTTATTDRWPFVRFGVWGRNTGGTDLTNRGQVQMSVNLAPVASRTLWAARRTVSTQGSTTPLFHPLTQPLPSTSMNEVRAVLEMTETTGDVEVNVAYQTSDTPDDPTSWSAASALDVTRSSVGFAYQDGFLTRSLTGRAVRFGVTAKNLTGSAIEVCQVNLRIDVRTDG